MKVHLRFNGAALCGLIPIPAWDELVDITSAVDPKILCVTCETCLIKMYMEATEAIK